MHANLWKSKDPLDDPLRLRLARSITTELLKPHGFVLWHSYHYGDDYTEPLIAHLSGTRHWIYTKKK